MKKYRNELVTIKQAIYEILEGKSKLSDFTVVNFDEYCMEELEDYPIGSIDENSDEDIAIIKRILVD